MFFLSLSIAAIGTGAFRSFDQQEAIVVAAAAGGHVTVRHGKAHPCKPSRAPPLIPCAIQTRGSLDETAAQTA
jgi:hypothetical protein